MKEKCYYKIIFFCVDSFASFLSVFPTPTKIEFHEVCGIFRIFLWLRFYVKSIVENLWVLWLNCYFCHFKGSEFCWFGKFQPSKSTKIHKNLVFRAFQFVIAQCGNFMIFLLLMFYVTSILGILEMENCSIERLWIFFFIFVLFEGWNLPNW